MTEPGIDNNTATPAGEFVFSDRDFDVIARLANEKYGLSLQSSKKPLVYSRLAKRLRALGLPSFDAYCALLADHNNNASDEHSHLLSALTTNVTHFFREKHHFDLLESEILPKLIEKAKAGSPVRLWSSACSAGQEAYSMAASILKLNADADQRDIKILATDIDPMMIQKAKDAVYPLDQLSAIPSQYRSQMLEAKENADSFRINAKARGLVSLNTLNLIGAWPMKRQFDVIVCRNAAIYFDKTTQARLWQRFSDLLTSDGYLIIGHSERLNGPAADHFRSVGITAYQKIHSSH